MQDRTPDPASLDPIERASVDELRALQVRRLHASLRHAYANVPHYRAAFDAAGVHPDDCRDLSDLARFPFTTKADLRANYPFGMFAVPRERIARLHASSGTTGQPTVVGYTAGDLDMWAEVMARSIRAAGGRPGDRAHIAYGYGLFTGGLGAHYGAEKLGCAVIPVSGGMTERQVSLIRDFEPDLIMVTPSYMLAIIDEMQRQGLDPATTSLKLGIFGAEPWTTTCAGKWNSGWTCTPWTSTVCPRSSARAWGSSASTARAAFPSGRTTSTRRSSTRSPGMCCPTVSTASWSSPH
nr:hypothetical protein [Nakamurella multipartita]